MLDRAFKERRAKLDTSQGQMIEMRPEFVDALKKSVNFSSMIQ
jgi:hypothetical protein